MVGRRANLIGVAEQIAQYQRHCYSFCNLRWSSTRIYMYVDKILERKKRDASWKIILYCSVFTDIPRKISVVQGTGRYDWTRRG